MFEKSPRGRYTMNDEKDLEDIYTNEIQTSGGATTVALGLPIMFHDDGTPVFERTDLVRPPVPIQGVNSPVIYQNLILPEHRALRPECRFNLMVLPSRTEEDLTRIYLGKAKEDPRTHLSYGRVLQSLDGTVKIIMQRMRKQIPPKYGFIDSFIVQSMSPMQLSVVPPGYEVEIVNFGTRPARVVEIQAKEEVRDTEQIQLLEGMGYILKQDLTLLPNANYSELPIPRFVPGLDSFKFLKKRPLYLMFSQYPKGFDFIDPPDQMFFHGAI